MTTTPVDAFLSSIRGLGHPAHPLLDASYSPSSRTPCTDLTPFIMDRLRHGDVASIKTILRGLLEANPGLGVGPEWINGLVDEVVQLPLADYVAFHSPDGMLELRALFLVASKEGGERPSWVSEHFQEFLATALACHEPLWLPPIENLVARANGFIHRMRREAPFWQEVSLFTMPGPPTAIDGQFAGCLRTLSVAARLQVLFIARAGPLPLSRASDYFMRRMGLNPHVTAREIRNSDILVPVSGREALIALWGKDELLALCRKEHIDHQEGWKKARLLDVLLAHGVEMIEARLQSEPVLSLNPRFAAAAGGLREAAATLTQGMSLLCFA